tara:strand:- start:1817 stop:2248 length:432 start_codon:yes stop_codon:yes gene_type:complete
MTTKITRREDWTKRLNAYVLKVHHKKFNFKTWNCIIFANGAVKAMTGADLYKKFRGTYSNEHEAAEQLREIGSGTVYKTLRSIFGNSIPVAMAQRGDLVIIKNPYSVGICRGINSHFVGNDGETHGIIEVGTLTADYAFKVGR